MMKDISRVINGATLVAKELAKRSIAAPSERPLSSSQDIINSLLKTTTNALGLTKGKTHHFQPKKQEVSDPGPQHSVVYFNAAEEHPTVPEEDLSSSSSSSSEEEGGSVGVGRVEEVVVVVGVEGDGGGGGVVGSGTESETGGGAGAGEGVPVKRRKARERKVPSTRFSRAFGFASLGAGLAWGTVQESAKRMIFGSPPSQDKQSIYSPFLSEKNVERLALALCRMRGAALKIGQMLSIQDESLVPAPLLAALDIVRQGADVMPRSQINKVLDAELGSDWSSKLNSFNYEPMAAASIGQVHEAVIRDGMHVAVKIQYPGVADSIESDIENLKLLDSRLGLIPEGLYLDRVVEVAKEELSRECDYELEARNQKLFRELLSDKEGFYVPLVVEELCSKRVLTTELVSGVPIDKVAFLDQETRNHVGKKLLELTLMELFVFRFMQTDPNWSNYLYDEATNTINLIDFGAARDYPKSFVDDYLRMVVACANSDKDTVIEMSQRLGFITGTESEIMLDAHVQAGFVVGLPFSKPGGFNFRSTNITQSLSNLGATMLKHRLTPPPAEAYSLHRKLSGAFLSCIKLGAVVPCRELLFEVYEKYRFGEDGGPISSIDTVQ